MKFLILLLAICFLPTIFTGCGDIRAVDTAKTAALAWTGTTYAIGYVQVGTYSTNKTYTFTNSGDDAAAGCSAPALSDMTNFSIVTDTCGTSDLGAGATCSVAVRANPTSIGVKTATLTRTCTSVSSSISALPGSAITSSTISAQGLSISVSARYTIAPNWNSYYRVATPTVACDGSESGFYSVACKHGGELKQAALTGVSSCTGLTAVDSLGVFSWICDATSGTATFYSTGLVNGKGLTDLVNATSFKSESLTISLSGTPIVSSASANWWTNTVAAAPANGGGGAVVVLTGVGTIYTIAATTTSGGYNFNSDGMALVTLNGAVLSYANGGTNCDWTNGSTAGGDRCLIVNRRNFFWLEGNYTAAGANEVLMMTNGTKFDRIRNVHASDAIESILYFWEAVGNLVEHSVFSKTAVGIGMESNNASFPNKFNIINDVSIFQMSWTGIFDYYSTSKSEQNIFTGVRLSGISGSGFTMGTGSSKSTFSHVTVLNDTGDAFNLVSNNDTISQVAIVNSATGLHLSGAGSNSKVANLAVGNTATGVSIATTGNIFTGNLLVGTAATSRCNITVASAGLVNTTCSDAGTDGSTAYTGAGTASNAVFNTSFVNFTSSFLSKVTTTDSVNASNTLGLQAIASVTDWLFFETMFRGWGVDGPAFPNSGNRGLCTAGNCRIWDQRLSATDTVLRNKSGNGMTVNTAFVADGVTACPAAVDGAVTMTDQMTVTHTYLLNATEVQGRGGNDNGLCENGETCVYSPNFGAYQGEGALTSLPCKFHDGTVTGVTMYGYTTNGI